MSAVKPALKSLRAKLQGGEHEAALYEATNLLKQVGEKHKEAPTVLSYRALALTHLERIEEAEKSYLQALRLDARHLLANPGLKKLYTTAQRWDDLGLMLERGVQSAYDDGDGEAVSKAMQDLLEHRVKHGPEEKLYATLGLLVPSSPVVPLIQHSTVPKDTYVPLALPVYPLPPKGSAPSLPSPLPHVYHLAGSLALTEILLLTAQVQIRDTTERQVKVGRQRIGARSERDVRRSVDADVLSGPLGRQLVSLLGDVSSHPSVDEQVRRDVEVEEFRYWKRLVGVLKPEGRPDSAKTSAKGAPKAQASSTSKAAPKSVPQQQSSESKNGPSEPALFLKPDVPAATKLEALSRADGMANGFVLLGVNGVAEDAWAWVLEGRDETSINYDLEFLHRYCKAFPTSPLTDFIEDYCRLFKLPPPELDGTPTASAGGEGESASAEKKPKNHGRHRRKGQQNARERRRLRRLEQQEGQLSEDVAEEEKEELIASMSKLLERLPKSIFAHRVMARVAIKEEDWVNAISYAEKGRKLVTELESERGIKMPHAHTSLDEALGVALVPYYPPKHHSRAIRLLDGVLKVLPTDYEARFARAQILQHSGDWTGAQTHFQTLLDQGGNESEMIAAREELGWCLVNQGKLEEGREVLEEVVELRDSRKEQTGVDDEPQARARAWWRLGQVEWMIGTDESKSHAENWFMASLRADATFAAAYTGLGICYSEAHSPPDSERALRCFQKAFELDATETEAAKRLAYGYADDGEWAHVRAIATRVMEGEGGVEGVAGGQVTNGGTGRFAPKNGWAWKALGSTEMFYNNYPKAIEAYQVALRADQNDAGMWRMLGEAYLKSGRHMAALKALNHALELDPTMWMAKYFIGQLYVQLGSYDKAVDTFQEIEKANGGGEVGVTAAIAEATLALGTGCAAGGFHNRSRAAFHTSISSALRVLASGRTHRPWAWKVIGDACLQIAKHEVKPEDVEGSATVLRPVLQALIDDDTDRRSALPGLGHATNLLQGAPGPQHTAKAAVFAFAYRAHLLKNEPRVAKSALYDLACALHALAVALPDVESDLRTSVTKAAVSSICQALERDPSDEWLWNALGVICSSAGKQLAQHAFVVSLECYSKSPIVWTNLGYLYLSLEDLDLADQCFRKSQIFDPDSARAWYGQGLIAELDGQREQATALFAHAVTLSGGSLLEADLALALGSFERYLVPGHRGTLSLQQPAFALRRYTEARPRDAASKHLYALICERLGLVDNAVTALESAVTLLEEEYEANESAEIEGDYAIALCNLGRVRLASGEYAKSLEAFSNCTDMVGGSEQERVKALDVQAKLGAALAHFWLDDLDASLESFQGALDSATDDTQLTDELVVLLARTLWGVGGEDAREAAKSHLMECLGHPDPGVKVVAALGAVGLVSDDRDLVEAAISELKFIPAPRALKQDPAGTKDLVLFAHALIGRDQEAALHALEQAALADPSAAGPRNRLAKAYLANGQSAEAAALLRGVEAPRHVPAQNEAAETERLRGEAAVLEGETEGTSSIQRAIMLAPWEDKNWEALAWARRAVEEVESEQLAQVE